MLRYDLRYSEKNKMTGIEVKHGRLNESIFFEGVERVNGATEGDKELFKCLNMFFAGLPGSVIDKHWDLLKKALSIIDPGIFDDEDTPEIMELRSRNYDYEFIGGKLIPILNDMYANIDGGGIEYAAKMGGFLVPPENLDAITKRGIYPEATTIDDPKYVSIVSLVFVSQLIFPVINRYLDHIKAVTGKKYKYAVAGEIARHIPTITSHRGHAVLTKYLTARTDSQSDWKCTDIDLSNEIKYIDNMLYKGLFGRLCLSFIPGKSTKNISNYLNSLVSSENKPNNKAKFKVFTDLKPTGDDLSIQESYNISQEVNASEELTHAEYFTFDLIEEKSPGVFTKKNSGFFKYQCMGLGIKNQHIAEQIYRTLPVGWGFKLENLHIKLLQLTFQYEMNYRIYAILDYDQLMAAIALAQTKLFEMGLERLASCLMATRSDEVPLVLCDETYKLTAEDKELLERVCPVYLGDNKDKMVNAAVDAAQKFLDVLNSTGWKTNIEPGLLGNPEYLEAMSSSSYYELDVCTEIKNELMTLIRIRNNIEE